MSCAVRADVLTDAELEDWGPLAPPLATRWDIHETLRKAYTIFPG